MIWDVPHTLAFLSQLLRAPARRPRLHRHAGGRGRGGRGRHARRARIDGLTPLAIAHRVGAMALPAAQRPRPSSAATTIARRCPTIRAVLEQWLRAVAAARERYAPKRDLRYGPESARDARSLRARRHAARHVRRSSTAATGARSTRTTTRSSRRPLVDAGHRGRRHRLRPVPGRHDRDDRRRMPARARVDRPRRPAARRRAGPWSWAATRRAATSRR